MDDKLFNSPFKNTPVSKVQLTALFILLCGQFQIWKLLCFVELRDIYIYSSDPKVALNSILMVQYDS